MLTTTVIIILTSFCTAAFVRFVDFCFGENKILHGYYLWMQKKTVYKFTNMMNMHTKELEQVLTDHHWLYMPLGGCIYCMGFWLCVPTALFACKIMAMPLLWCFFTFWAIQSLNFFFIELQNKILS